MGRKVFWYLWITVWPALALYPHWVTAQAPDGDLSEVPRQMIIAPDVPEPEPTAITDPFVKPPTAVPSQIVSQPAVEAIQPEELPEVAGSESSPTSPGGNAAAIAPFDEQLPIARTRTPDATRQPVTAARTTRRTGAELTAQEEKAHALIHERAAQRGLERQARLESKHRPKYAQNIPAPSTRWQPHLAGTKYLAGTRKPPRP